MYPYRVFLKDNKAYTWEFLIENPGDIKKFRKKLAAGLYDTSLTARLTKYLNELDQNHLITNIKL